MPRRPTYEPLGTALRFALVFLSSRFLLYVNEPGVEPSSPEDPHRSSEDLYRAVKPVRITRRRVMQAATFVTIVPRRGLSFFITSISILGGIPSDRTHVCMCDYYVIEQVTDFNS